MKILIDNGHGQETAGKRSPDGRLLEWSYNREIAGLTDGERLHGLQRVPGILAERRWKGGYCSAAR